MDWIDNANHSVGGAIDGMIALQMHYSNAATPRWAAGGYHRFRKIAVKEF